MSDEPNDDNPQDLTVYDLAERHASGMEISDAGKQEIYNELVRLRNEVHRLDDADELYFRESTQDEAKALLWLKAELEAILKPPT